MLMDRQAVRHTGRQTERQSDSKPDRQTDKQTDRQVLHSMTGVYRQMVLLRIDSFFRKPLFQLEQIFLGTAGRPSHLFDSLIPYIVYKVTCYTLVHISADFCCFLFCFI